MNLSKISLGCVTFGREIDRDASIALLDHGYSRGIRLFDTAAAYGSGASEAIIGEWLATRRPTSESLCVATKILPPFTPAQIESAISTSQKRLGVESIDLLFLHRWDSTAQDVQCLRTLDRLVKDGRVTALGASNFNAVQLQSALRLQLDHQFSAFKVVQNNHNYAVRDVDAALLELCARNGIDIVTYSPLGAGFLTGKHQNGAAPDTRFTLIPGHQGVYFNERAFQRLAALQALEVSTGYTKVQLALAWALQQPGIASVLVGGRTPAHLDQAFDALALGTIEFGNA